MGAIERGLRQTDQDRPDQSRQSKSEQRHLMADDYVPVVRQGVISGHRGDVKLERLYLGVGLATLLRHIAQLGQVSIGLLDMKSGSFHSASLVPASGPAPDDQAGSRLNRCLDGPEGCFLAQAAGNKQNVIALKGNVSSLSDQNAFYVH